MAAVIIIIGTLNDESLGLEVAWRSAIMASLGGELGEANA